MSDGQVEQGAGASGSVERATVGESLRLARESRGETIGDVADALKLTHRQVEAMEMGRFDLLPGPAFVRGFVRNYARHLGLDPTAVLTLLEHETAAPAVELTPVSNAEGTMPNGAGQRLSYRPVLAVLMVLVLAVVAGWYFDWFEPADTTTGIEVQPDPAAPGELVPPSPEPAEPGEVDPATSEPGSNLRMTPVPPGWEPAPAELTGGAPAADAPVVPPAATQPVPVVPPLASQAPDPAPSASTESTDRLVFRAEGESWLEVRDADGTLVFSGVAPAGSTRAVEGKPPFRIVIGNAPQVTLEYRGQPVDLSKHNRGVARLTVQ